MNTENRETIIYLSTYFGEMESVGITAENVYIYNHYLGTTSYTEMFAISHEQYLNFIAANETEDECVLRQLRNEIFLSPAIALEGSRYEPRPIRIPAYGHPRYEAYYEIIRNHIILSAAYRDGCISMTTKTGETIYFQIEQNSR